MIDEAQSLTRRGSESGADLNARVSRVINSRAADRGDAAGVGLADVRVRIAGDRDVLASRFGLGRPPTTHDAVSDELGGLSREGVRKLEVRTMKRLAAAVSGSA